MAETTYYVTTAIFYVNDVPHVGSSSEAIAADVLARYKRLQGCNTLFVTGTDENAIKVAEVAQGLGLAPQQYVDEIAPKWVEVFRRLHISYDDFIRTTQPRHRKVVEAAFLKLLERGDIYKDLYKGWYCVSDETFFRESDVVDGLCPNFECRKPVRWVEEENYFFRLSAYADRLLEYIETHPDFLGPEFRKNEVISFIKAGLRDACITRKAYGWGIEVPGDPDQVIYVWFDALLNYITAAGYLSDEQKFATYWPVDAQFLGKDIFVRFHSTLWPAMLMGLDLPLPKRIFGHGWWTIEGEKMSKSKGNVLNPVTVAEELAGKSGANIDIAVDAIRYYLLREATFGMDGDFSLSGLVASFNSDLANDLGNLLNRTLSMMDRYFDRVVPQPAGVAEDLKALAESTHKEVEAAIDRYEFSRALEAIWQLVGAGNRYIEDQAPWKLHKEGKAAELATALYSTLETARIVTIMIAPFMPEAAKEMWRQLGINEPLEAQTWADAGSWGKLAPGTRVNAAEPIFPRIEEKPRKEEAVEEKAAPEPQYLTYDEFKKMELRIAEIKAAERVENADKLLKLTVSLGDEERAIVAGIAQWYETESLVGKKIVLLANLAPATIRGVQSQGMLLAADVEGRAVILTPDSDVPAGSKIR